MRGVRAGGVRGGDIERTHLEVFFSVLDSSLR